MRRLLGLFVVLCVVAPPTLQAAAATSPAGAAIAADPFTVSLSDLDVDTAAELLRTVHAESGHGHDDLRRAQSVRAWGGLISAAGVGALLTSSGRRNNPLVKIGVAFVATGAVTWFLGAGKGARATRQIEAAYNRLDAAVLGKEYTPPEERVIPRRKTRFGK